jgi:D-beta-D-heptose 7-phosphate kinase / D-beta-D-heptose 1-phosphate adenosyltransferase
LTKVANSERLLVVAVNGCFDIIHPGHIDLLQWAWEEGSPLVVLLNSDESVRRLKGSGHPLMSQEARKKVLGALKVVSSVMIYGEDTPNRVLAMLQPDILVKGHEYKDRRLPEREVVEGYGGEIKFAPMTSTWHSSDIMRKIV